METVVFIDFPAGNACPLNPMTTRVAASKIMVVRGLRMTFPIPTNHGTNRDKIIKKVLKFFAPWPRPPEFRQPNYAATS
jgi:hypothetical protein